MDNSSTVNHVISGNAQAYMLDLSY